MLSLLKIRNALNMVIGRGEMGETERDAVLDDIRQQLESGYFRMAETSQSEIYAKAEELSNRHTKSLATRSLAKAHAGIKPCAEK